MDPFELIINTSLTTRDYLKTVKLFKNLLDEHHVEVDRHTCIMSKGVPGDFIDEHFRNKEIGHSEHWSLFLMDTPF